MTLECEHSHPVMLATDRHHIQPKAWGGSDDLWNIAIVCPNTHRLTHTLLNRYKKLGAPPPWSYKEQFSRHVRELAKAGWLRTMEQNTVHTLKRLPDL